ncbi:glycosyltransferase 87 family protein [Propionibacteriaceae bacterium Y1923]
MSGGQATGRHAAAPEPTIAAPPPQEAAARSRWLFARHDDGHGHPPPPWWRHVRRQLGAVWVWVLLFVLSRAWIFHLWATKYEFIRSDVNYYLWWLSGDRTIQETLIEYPLPVVWFLDSLTLLGSGSNSYSLAFGLAMFGLDALFCIALFRRGTLRALLFWNAFVTFFGSLIWFRYDMVPAFAVGMAALYISRHPRVSGALVAIGAGLKLWPAMLIAPLLGRSRPALLRTFWFGATGFALAGLAFLHGGWDRLVSPLTWQSDRGLQVESVPASLLMWQHAKQGNASPWRVEMSKYNAFEIFGPGTENWMTFSDVVMVLAVLSAAGMAVVALVRKQLPTDLAALAMTSIVLAMLVANKTLSPQYLLWLGTPVAALLALAHTRTMRLRAHLLAAGTLLAAFGTQQVYPVWYGHIVGANPQLPAMGLLVARNLLLVVMMLVTTVWVWADLTAPGEPADEPEPPLRASEPADDFAEED